MHVCMCVCVHVCMCAWEMENGKCSNVVLLCLRAFYTDMIVCILEY